MRRLWRWSDNSIKSESIDNIKEENFNNLEKKDLNEILQNISKIELQKLDAFYEEKDSENKGNRSSPNENPSPPSNTTRGRPKKEVSASLNEIRLKLLQLPEPYEYNSKTLYELARLYMFGNKKKSYVKENWEDSTLFNQFKTNTMKNESNPLFLNDSLDLLATQEIRELPKSRKDIPVLPKWPSPLKNNDQDNVDVEDREDILRNHIKHWKKVRRSWLNYSKIRYPQHSRSMQLLETVYGISQASRNK
ncbi:Protein LIN37 family-containing protein [Strongyloides ratti]|uniref:Protein LIN37 family-containing protein n=1 Tax=Strongyloides ratti TaxID=34506 RepID=A0A090L1H2_STRRB|nr:Protein LIN37 family-containing protein [Strongyloides ratti]CEF61967.1 Protein LIN37 family-containing protein [Strongyloides ratti]